MNVGGLPAKVGKIITMWDAHWNYYQFFFPNWKIKSTSFAKIGTFKSSTFPYLVKEEVTVVDGSNLIYF